MRRKTKRLKGTYWITPELVVAQLSKYNQPDREGRLYGAMIVSVRDYIKEKNKGKYGEQDLGKEIPRIADVSKELGYRIEAQNRLLTKEEAYTQISHRASLFKATPEYVEPLK